MHLLSVCDDGVMQYGMAWCGVVIIRRAPVLVLHH
jgi:hypothetical protein